MVQFVVVKSVFCSNAKLPGGDGQETATLALDSAMLNGAGDRVTSNIGLARLVAAKIFVPP